MPAPTLLFIYAVDSGALNAVRDYVHKIISPKTYPCKLCELTYGPLGEDKAWACMIERLPLRSEVLHRDEFLARYPATQQTLPAVILDRGEGVLDVLVSAEEMGRCVDAEALAKLVRDRVEGAAAA